MNNPHDNYMVAASKSQDGLVKKLAKDWNLTIDDEFKDLLHDHTPAESTLFEHSMLHDGCRDALIVWAHDGKRILVDGHHRYDFCEKHGMAFAIREMDFADRESVKEWIILNQLARRNLPMHEHVRLALQLKPIFEARAKENQAAYYGNQYDGLPQKSAKVQMPIDTRKEIAKIAGVSHDTVANVERIEKEAPEPIKRAARAGEISVNAAYHLTKAAPDVKQDIVDEMKRGEKPIKQIVKDAIIAEKEESDMQAAARAFNDGEAYSIDNFIEEIMENGEDCIDTIRTHIETRITLFGEASGRVATAIDKIIEEFSELKMEVKSKWN